MDEFSSKRTASGLFFSRRCSRVVERDRNTMICSRDGCSSRMSSIKDNQIESDKTKTRRRPFHLSINGKEAIGSSSRTPVGPTPRKSSDPHKKLPFQQVTNSEPCYLPEEIEAPGPVIKSHDTHGRLNSHTVNDVSGESTSVHISSSSSVPQGRHGKKAVRRFELGIHDSSMLSSTSLAFKNGNHGSKTGASSSRYSFKNLKCSLLNNVESSSTSTLSSSSSDKRGTDRKRVGETESSLSTRGKKITGPWVDSRRSNDSRHGVSLCGSRTRNLSSSSSNDVTSVTTRRSTARARLNEQENQIRRKQTASSSLMPLLPQPDISLDTNASVLECSSRRANASGRLANTRANIHGNVQHALCEADLGCSFASREDVRQYNLDGIAEMLLALDGIEQDEELSFEQLLLETNLFLRGLAFHDQHRDMRMDIDNMSYEELLALEERMGTVSTALSEEALAKFLEKSFYEAPTDEQVTGLGEDGDDIKCSICQEEYKDGDEVGRLVCDHRYHVECIQQWLQMKNWCPICKASAAPPSSSSSPSSPSS